MILERSNFHIFSGGPGAGKTTVLEALRARGFTCIDEAARQILKEQKAIGGNATHDGDQARYRDLTLARAIEAFEAVTERVAPVFFDRGVPEQLGYPASMPSPAHVLEAVRRYRYNRTVFVFPPWEAIYCHDEERKHSFQHAIDVFALVRATYQACGYATIEVPCAPVEDRADFILGQLGAM
jgi:predicted ATPase